jgi:hypothetical protein
MFRAAALAVLLLVATGAHDVAAEQRFSPDGAGAPEPTQPGVEPPPSLNLTGFFVGSFNYSSALQIVPDASGAVSAASDPGRTSFRFDKFGLGVSRVFNHWLSAAAAIEAESHRDRHSHLVGRDGAASARFDCPVGRACERWGLEPTDVEVGLDRFHVTAMAPVGNGLGVALGRFDVPFGIERHDDNLNLTATTSEVFRFGRPQRMTGLQLAYAFSPRVEAAAWLVNRWEAEDTLEDEVEDNNAGKSIGGRLGFALAPRVNLLSLGLGGWLGRERSARDGRRSLVTADLTWSPNPRVVVALEVVRGSERVASLREVGEPVATPHESDKPTRWTGYSALVHYDVSRALALSVRHGLLDDGDRARTGVPQRLQSLTIAPTLHLSAWIAELRPLATTVPRTSHPYHWVDLVLEYRLNLSDRPAFGEALPNVSLHDKAARRSHQLQLQLAVNF